MSMSFPVTQLGRFGDLCNGLIDDAPGEIALDFAAALAIAAGEPFTRPSLALVLQHRGFLVREDPRWKEWSVQFVKLTEQFGLPLLKRYAPCPRPVPHVAGDCCPHSFTPPKAFGTLRSNFPQGVPNNVSWRSDGRADIITSLKPSHLFVVLEDGEILVSLEDENWFKHPSLSGGTPVWSAGEFGSHEGKICVVNLASGHYVSNREDNDEQYQREGLTRQIFKEYCDKFPEVQLHERFWVSPVPR